MSCREVVDRLGDYLEGELSGGTRAALEAHLAHCASCAAYWSDYRATRRLVAAMGKDAPAQASESLVRAILAACEAGV